MNILRHSVQVQSAPGTCTCVSIFLLESERGFRLPVDVVFALRKSLFSITQRLSRKKCLSALTKTISPLVLGQKKKRKRRSQYELLTTTGGSGGRSDGDKSGICWNFSSAPNPSGAEDDDPNKPSTIMGNRILDMNQISENISKHTVCRMCSENEVNSAVLEKTKDHEKFIDFVENYELEFTRLLSVARKGTAMSTSKRKGIRQLHGEYKKQKANKKAAASTPEKNKVSQSAATKKKSSAAK